MQLNIDREKYGRAARKWEMPRAIANSGEYKNALKLAENLMDKEGRTAEETALLETWVKLIESYEDDSCSMPSVPADKMLKFLLDQRALKAIDLVPAVFSTRGYASQVINGQREISREIALLLASYFHVSVDFFIRPRPKRHSASTRSGGVAVV